MYYFERIKNEISYISNCCPDIIFVLGLSQLIPREILNIPSIGCIGSHPALLPQNRGRHPIIWSIANGLTRSGVTLFWIDEGVDSGDIWAQEQFDINPDDTARTVYDKTIELTIDILKRKISELERGAISRTPQDHSKANYLRKRTIKDGEINWETSSKRIYDLVRALSRPYPGAHCMIDGKEVKVWKARIVENNNNAHKSKPGTVVKITNDAILVSTADGLIEISEYEFKSLPKVGDCL